RRGRWYVVGHNRDRDASRAFRLSRIVGDLETVGTIGEVSVPPDLDLAAQVAELDAEPGGRTAVVRFRRGHGWDLRRTATACAPEPDGEWDRCDVPMGDVDRLADVLVGYGPDVVALEPTELRDAVVARLQSALAATDAA
ncbi:MAG TPA: WYL domain-containing protein, partial [Mycobacteriales bacterium]|nr:WYL domain-containing protein [Mycobacteriales bacterium]